MRSWVQVLVAVTILCAACSGRQAARTPPPAGAFADVSSSMLLISPGSQLVGKVVRVNVPARFVVLNFPIAQLPAVEQRMFLYRAGVKTGEVKITGPQMDDTIVADLIKGDAAPGDEVRGE